MVNSQFKPFEGSVILKKTDEDAKMKELSFKNAYIVHYQEGIDAKGETPMIVKFTISAESIKLGNAESSGGGNNVSQAGLNFIAGYESFSPNVYRVGGKGNPTIGYGHEVLPRENFSGGITKAQAYQLLRHDAAIAVNAINRNVSVTLNQNQFDALTSYVFNAGSGAIGIRTQLLSSLNAGNFWGAASQMDINTSGGVFMQGLENRRIAERNLFLNGIYR